MLEVGGNWYGFVVVLGSNRIERLDFGESLDNTPTVTDLGNIDSQLNLPYDIKVVENGGSWYGLVTNFGNSQLILVDFGANINNNAPSASAITLTGGLLTSPRGIDAIYSEGEHHVFITNFSNSNLVHLEFSDFVSAPSESTIAIGSGGLGVAVLRSHDAWYVYTTSTTVTGISFGSSLNNSPSATALTLDSSIGNGTLLHIYFDAGTYVGVLGSRSGNVYRLNLGLDLSTMSGSVTDLGNFSTFSDLIAFTGAKEDSRYRFFGVDINSTSLQKTVFPEVSCGASLSYSEDEEPASLSYTTSGTHYISLQGEGTNGSTDLGIDSVYVRSTAGPDISVGVDNSRCILNSNTFTSSINSGNVSTYSWDFDGDNIEDSDQSAAVFNYLSTGDYTAMLTATSSEGCESVKTLDISIYNAPPTPNFDMISPSSCTNTDLSFENLTDSIGLEGVIGYNWDFAGEGVSTDKDPAFRFTTTGNKTISLEAFIPGCTTAVYQEVIELFEGPSVSFSFLNNCFGDTVQFTNESTGIDITGYTWDLGDGMGTSTAEDTSYRYSSPGDYTVVLAATNIEGCTNSYSEDLQVNGDALVDFTSSDAVEFFPVQFDGSDLTLTADSIISWLWDFNSLGSSTDEDPIFSFTSPGDYSVSLDIQTAQGCIYDTTKTVTVAEAPISAIFSVSDTLCIGEPARFTNQSLKADTYRWDFCQGDLSETPLVTSAGTLGAGSKSGLDIVEVGGNWYGFSVVLGSNRIERLDFGSSLDNAPTITDLGNIDSQFNVPYDIKVVEDAGSWYGLVTNFGSSQLILVDFGSNIDNNAPSATAISLTVGLLASPRGIDAAYSEGEHHVFITNFSNDNLVHLKFSDLVSSPSESTITIGSGGLGVAVLKSHDGWYVYTTSTNITGISFGSSLNGSPVAASLSLDTPISNGSLLHVYFDAGRYVGILGSRSGSVYRMDLGLDLSSMSATVTDLGGFSVFSDLIAFTGIKDSSRFRFFGVDLNSADLQKITFPEAACGVSINYSEQEDPMDLSFSTTGTFYVSLEATGSDGASDIEIDSIYVRPTAVPNLVLTVDDSRCILNSNSFNSAIVSGDVSSYSWDFDGDNLEDSDQSGAVFQYLATGDYSASLTTTNSVGCESVQSLDISIYNVPPTPDFDLVSSSACTNADLSFENLTDSTGLEGVIGYNWDFAGEGVSSAKDPEFQFTTIGNKTISLEAFIPGCTTAIHQEVIELFEGPSVSFTFLNNCFADTVQFANESTGVGITAYSWDLGDGIGTSVAEDTSYRYNSAGSYTVSLTATNIEGCSSSYSSELHVNEDPIVSFASSEAVEFFPVQFEGTDLTLSGDSIVNWLWDFDGLGSSTEEDPTFTFNSPGSYSVALDIQTAQGCRYDTTRTVNVSEAPLTASFTATDSVCSNERVVITNQSLKAESYHWDFCQGDLLEIPVLTDVATLGSGSKSGLDIVQVGSNWYGFAVVLGSNRLERLDFGESLDNTPTVTDLGNIDSKLNLPYDIKILQSGGAWYGLVTNFGNSELILVDFGLDVDNGSPTASAISLTAGLLSSPRGIDAAYSEGEYHVFVSNFSNSNLVHLTFNDFVSSPSESTIAVGTDGLGVAILRAHDGWYVYTTSTAITGISFGSSLNNTPAVSALSLSSSITNGTLLNVYFDAGKYVGILGSRSGNVYRIDLGFNLAAMSATVTDLGDFSAFSDLIAFAGVKENSHFRFFGVDFGESTLHTLLFSNGTCGSMDYSAVREPTDLAFNSSGTYYISLEVTSAQGEKVSRIDSVHVTTNIAPSISFTIDSSRCALNANTFSAEPSIGLSYNWDFSGEGSGNSGVQTFQFPTSGEKTVLLTVSDGICSNQATETLTIYPAPPDPVFAFDEAQYCAELDFEVNNTTDDAAFNGNLTYEWIVEADSDLVFSGPDPTFNVPPIGTFLVTAQTSVPGCESNIVTDSVTIEGSPATDFSYTPTCDGEITEFTNLTTGAISQQWDFGDNFTSTQFAPDHYYDSVTTYLVTLTAFNELGCSRTHTDSVSIGNLPVPGFRVTQACEGDVALEDTSTVVGADIAIWEWSLENELFSSVQNPTQEITEPGTYLVRQKVTSSLGCESELLQEINIFDAAEIAFETVQACDGDPFTFTDASSTINGNPIISRSWDINGTLYSDAELQHTFPAPGEYDATLVVTTQNLCTTSLTETVTVYDVPALDFSTLGGCQHEYLTIDDRSAAGNDTIISRSWYLDGQIIGSGRTLQYRFDNHGANTVTLSTVTEQGCVYELAQNIDIAPAAVAAFESSTTFGDLGTQIVFDNTSTLGSNFLWRVGEDSVATSQNFSYQFDESGDFSVSLIAVSDFNCADTITQDIRIRRPEVDLIINEMILQQEDELFSTIVVSLENQSNLPVDDLIFTVTVDEQLPTRDRVSDVVEIGETRVFQLGTSVPNQATFICVEVDSGYGTEDASPGDNEFCVNIEPQVIFQDPYPNPASDETVVRTILPDGGNVTLTLIDVSGKIELKETYKELLPGLQAFTVALQHLEAGMYVLRIEHNGQTDTKRILKQ